MTDHIESGPGFGSPLDFAVDRQSRMTMATVRRAVARGDAVLAYQPIVRADGAGQVAFYEGLIRIIDETGRIVPLRDFMELAETTELGRQIDCISLGLGLEALGQDPALRLSINMSARSIGYAPWLRTLREGIARDISLAERLVLEVTESSAMGLPEVIGPFMQELQAHGVSFALDDFGAGYTSFRYLRDFCFDMIKIDGQFVREIACQRDNQVLARALQSIAHHFDMFTVAEQVETAEDAAFLIEMGIDCLQGYYFGAPTIVPPWRSPNSAAKRT
ncbi:MAG TPA: EAL domain-containing protein [Paracoccus sp. (in: a-proteobacteria)]|uniref:EAL domain-containing protein n=1 Tax=Paracoccus sp. TaxID=267 RepID=UPI002C55AAE4|nr:EAL domain-containing protein [Paracoccus sp. (in: a-proteobacteria)]HWL56648.1 EAL domain-containing protein [Paracoccus sp. (in: a-proteobacteria)]